MAKYNLLYVEDDIETIDSVLYFIEKKFNDIYIANEGKQALEFIETHPIDLLLLDINIPNINGLQLAEKVRQKNSSIPILFLTAHSEKTKLLKAIKLQVHGYILKPLDINELTSSLNEIINYLDSQEKPTKIVSLRYGFHWNLESEELKYENTKVPLTKNETVFIRIMLENKFSPLTFNEIKERLFDDYEIKDNSIVQLVARLKKKAKKISNSNNFFIENIYQYGYKLSIDE